MELLLETPVAYSEEFSEQSQINRLSDTEIPCMFSRLLHTALWRTLMCFLTTVSAFAEIISIKTLLFQSLRISKSFVNLSEIKGLLQS